MVDGRRSRGSSYRPGEVSHDVSVEGLCSGLQRATPGRHLVGGVGAVLAVWLDIGIPSGRDRRRCWEVPPNGCVCSG